MRYIKTRNGKIIDLKDKFISSYGYETDCTDGTYYFFVYYFDPDKGSFMESDGQSGQSMDSWPAKEVKVADELEELINRYISDNKGHKKIMTKSKFEDQTTKKIKKMLDDGVNIFGAIWTEWGLKYAVKMNDKGELELL